MRVLVLFCLADLAAAAEAPKPEDLPSLRGEVRNSVTGEPVAKARLMLRPSADAPDA